MKKVDRNYIYDFIRAFAIISVVFCHSIESVYYIFQDRSILYSGLSFESKMFDLLGITFGRLGVPLFLFLTGALLGRKNYDNKDDVKNFYKNKFLPLLITLEIWFLIWNIFIVFYFSWRGEIPNISLFTFFQNIFLLKTVDYILPAWYAPMILGIYLFIPFISNVLNKYEFKNIKIPLIVGILYFFIIPTINLVLNIYGLTIISNIDLYFSGGIYGIYFIVGFYLSKGLLKKTNSIVLYVTFLISFLCCVIFQYFLINKGVFYKIGYENIFLFVSCCSLFEIFTRLSIKGKFANLCTYLSKISFPIFLIHNLIQYIIYQLNIFSSFIRPLNVNV